MSGEPRPLKIFPRNLTARADYVVRGNPVNSRPESGVDNCYAGLEYDSRNLEQAFFPGLRFEYQRDEGAILAAIEPLGLTYGLRETDATAARPLFLWFIYGRTVVADPEPAFFVLRAQNGMDVWRRVHDLLPERVAILIGPSPGFTFAFNWDDAKTALERAYGATSPDAAYSVVRDESGALRYAVLGHQRARYLDEDGVIDPDAYAPGELTKTMCVPWIYDFRDCYCFYWAANKPDFVSSADGEQRYLNFMRRDRTANAPADLPGWEGRVETELTHEDLVDWWHRLPIVIDDRETEASAATVVSASTVVSAPADLLDRGQVIAELSYLATVEHALTVEYLFAMFTIAAPGLRPPDDASDDAKRVYAASRQLLGIAIDEMRHFLWVNQALAVLGSPASTGRAHTIAQPPAPDDERKPHGGKQYLNRPFALRPLEPATLDWFIEVEEPSRVENRGLDGMYVELLRSVRDQPDIFREHERLVPVIKLIVDEGGEHHKRFAGVRETLAGLGPERYLRTLDGVPTPRQDEYLKLCDVYYEAILDAVVISFSLGDAAGSMLVREAVHSMRNLEDVARVLAEHGVAPRFRLHDRPRKKLSHSEALERLDAHSAAHADAVGRLAEGGTRHEVLHAERHRREGTHLFARLRELVVRDAHQT